VASAVIVGSLQCHTVINPKIVVDQQGHTVDVNQNVYTQSPLEIRREAVETIASAFVN